MTVNNATAYSQQTAGASQTKFTLDFQFEKASDLTVYQTPVGDTPDPATQQLTLNTDYTVVGAGWGNPLAERSVNLVTGATSGDILTIVRSMPLARETDFNVSGEFSAADLNNQFDDLVGMIQQVDSKIEKRGVLYVENQILDSSSSSIQTTLPKLASQSGSDIPIWTTNSNGTLIASTFEEASSLSTLRADLADDINGSDGSRLVGYYNASLSPANTTVKAALDHVVGTGPVTFGAIGQVIFGYFASLSGWLEMDDGTIGPTASLADHNNDNYENLYTILWDNCADAQCPVTGGRSGSAAADWALNRPLRLPQVRERSVAVYNQASISSTFTISVAPTFTITLPSTAGFESGMVVQLTTTNTLPTGLATATDYRITVINTTTMLLSRATTHPPDSRTATAEQNYAEGTPGSPAAQYYVQATSAGIGTHTMTVQFDTTKVAGETQGYHDHVMLNEEIAPHTHQLGTSGNCKIESQPIQRPSIANGGTSYTTTSTGESQAFSVVSPITYMKAFIKYQ